jgi:DNA-binding MarR family transcriptional regulator
VRWLLASSSPASRVSELVNTQAVTRPAGDPGTSPGKALRSHTCGSLLLYAVHVADDETLRGLEHEMSVLVRRIRRVIAERARMLHPDLSPVAYSMLMALNDTGPRRASDLVEIFSIDKGAVSRQVQTLLELGLIERSPDPEDRRAMILAISEEGHRRLSNISSARRHEVGQRLEEWTDDELRAFVRGLARYNSALE